MTMRNFWRGAVAATALSMVALTAPAGAVTGAPPTPQDDHFTLKAGDFQPVDVLANDTDPDGDDLEVCRIGKVPDALFVASEGSQMLLGAGRPGTYTFTYYACDLSYLSPATVTVTVQPVPKMYLIARKSTHPGMLRVANRGKNRFQFLYGSYDQAKPDGRIMVMPHTSQLVPVRRTSLVWIALNMRVMSFRAGIIRGIELPKGTQELPPGAPPKGGSTVPLPQSTTGGQVSELRILGRTGARWTAPWMSR